MNPRIRVSTRDGRRTAVAYSDPRRALVITGTYKPIDRRVNRFGITHKRTGLLVCREALFPTLDMAARVLRALLPLGWKYVAAQDPVNDKRAARALARVRRTIHKIVNAHKRPTK